MNLLKLIWDWRGGPIKWPASPTVREVPQFARPQFVIDHQHFLDQQDQKFKAVDNVLDMIVDGTAKAAIISGPPGVGKTYSVLRRFEEAPNITFKLIKGFTRPTGLYTALHQYRFPEDRVVFDDCDSAFQSEESLNLLKAALDSNEAVRTLSWRSQSALKYVDEFGETITAPSEFDYAGGIVFLTNIDFDDVTSAKLRPHLDALMSRALYVELGMKTADERLVRVLDVCWRAKIPQSIGIDEATASEVYLYMILRKKYLRELSIRMATRIMTMAKTHPDEWMWMANVTCMNEDSHAA